MKHFAPALIILAHSFALSAMEKEIYGDPYDVGDLQHSYYASNFDRSENIADDFIAQVTQDPEMQKNLHIYISLRLQSLVRRESTTPIPELPEQGSWRVLGFASGSHITWHEVVRAFEESCAHCKNMPLMRDQLVQAFTTLKSYYEVAGYWDIDSTCRQQAKDQKNFFINKYHCFPSVLFDSLLPMLKDLLIYLAELGHRQAVMLPICQGLCTGMYFKGSKHSFDRPFDELSAAKDYLAIHIKMQAHAALFEVYVKGNDHLSKIAKEAYTKLTHTQAPEISDKFFEAYTHFVGVIEKNHPTHTSEIVEFFLSVIRAMWERENNNLLEPEAIKILDELATSIDCSSQRGLKSINFVTNAINDKKSLTETLEGLKNVALQGIEGHGESKRPGNIETTSNPQI